MITIIGAGWYGCYLGLKFQELGLEFEILEKSNDIFTGSSSFNQNRLHQGYHYPRDNYTRKTSGNGYNRFIREFPEFSKPIKKNLYAIHKDSLLDFQTYLSIYSFEKYNFKIIDNSNLINKIHNIEGMIAVEEKLIDFKKSKQFFKELNLPVRFNSACYYDGPDIFSKGEIIDSDIIFDCTYGQMSCPIGFYTEDYLSFIFKKKAEIDFDALTVMDGEFYSIYPYFDSYYTLTGVKEGIIDKKEYQSLGEENYVLIRRNLLEKKILKDYDTFLFDFEYSGYFISKKLKPRTNTNKRSTHILKNKNIYTICSGKIDTIFDLDYLISEMKSYKNICVTINSNQI